MVNLHVLSACRPSIICSLIFCVAAKHFGELLSNVVVISAPCHEGLGVLAVIAHVFENRFVADHDGRAMVHDALHHESIYIWILYTSLRAERFGELFELLELFAC